MQYIFEQVFLLLLQYFFLVNYHALILNVREKRKFLWKFVYCKEIIEPPQKKTVQEGHKDYKCDTCGKSYSQAQNLRNHIRIVHDHERHKDYKCDSCGKLYSYNGLLKHHIHVVHDGRKDHKCEPCAKSFTSAQYLKIHIRTIHEAKKDYKCL